MASKVPKIYIDPGHGDGDPGAVGYVKEADVTAKAAKYMKAYLDKNYLCETKMSSGSQTLNTRCNNANKWGANLFVSIHFNAGGGDGYEALVYSKANLRLGQTFEKYVKAVGQNSRGVKYRPDLAVLRLTNMEAILNETAFVDDKKDISDWDEDHELKVMGEALAKAAAAYTGAEKRAPELKALFKVKLKETMNVRIGPGTGFKRISGYKKNAVITIYDTDKNKEWGYTKKGWVCITKKYAQRI